MRTGSERIFSRLLSICMQNPPVIGLNATATMLHIILDFRTIILIRYGHGRLVFDLIDIEYDF